MSREGGNGITHEHLLDFLRGKNCKLSSRRAHTLLRQENWCVVVNVAKLTRGMI